MRWTGQDSDAISPSDSATVLPGTSTARPIQDSEADPAAAPPADAVRTDSANTAAPAPPSPLTPAPPAPPASEQSAAAGPEPTPAADDRQDAPEHPNLLTPRIVSAAERPSDGWLAKAVQTLAAHDPQAAAQLIVALLPVQRLLVTHDTDYDLTVSELGTFRVQLSAGAATVEPRPEPGSRREIDFHLEGPAGALGEFAGGGIRKRPKGTHLDGSRRKLRRLLKELREPVHLPDIARSGALIEPGLILAALAAGIDPAQTAGHTFTVAWHVTGQRGGTWTVKVGDGFPTVSEGEPEGGATAVVNIPQGAFLPLLAGVAPPPGLQATVDGNANAVALLRAWFDGAQKLS